jgi:Spy/CpxP family protein refolding chaperone
MKKSKWITAVAVLAFGTSLAIAGEAGKGGKHGRKGGMDARLAEKLNLTEAQKGQLAGIQQSFRAANEPFFTGFRETMKQYRDAKKAGDTAQADSLKATIESQRAQMKELRAAQELQIAAILTPEQRTQWDALKAERGGRKGAKRDRLQ